MKEYFDHVRALEIAYGEALKTHGFDAALIHSGSLARKTIFDDQDWPLRPTPHFQHWIPLAEPDCFLWVRPGRKPMLMRPRTSSFWESPPEPPARFFFEAFDVVEIDSWEKVRIEGRVAFVGEREDRSFGLPRDAELMRTLDALRTKKSAYEIACIAEANRVAARGHEAVRRAFEAGETNELRLHLLFLESTQQDDPETPYKNIVASGKNAATLHHVTYRKDASGAPSLLVDAGATHFGYCSDVTRTHVKRAGAASDAFDALVSAVDAMQKRLCAAIRAGTKYESLHDESHRQTSAFMREIGIVRELSPEAIDARGISRAFYPHGLGHSLGLQTHDVGCAPMAPQPNNPFLRNTSVIEPGQVFTIEPGFYFIESLLRPLREGELAKYIDWTLVDSLAPLGGIRVEDDVLVKPDGIRNFTREVLPG
ncbi:MAG TPA: Xaa-Pro dipeptidase [Polyangiaceae bacterium]